MGHLLNNRQSNRRRGRGRGPQGNNGRQDNGSRIDNRARGNAPQLLEKYKNLAREAQLQGDRVLTEYYLQFADHYFRIVAENRARFEESRQPRRDEWQNDDGFDEASADEGHAEAMDASDASDVGHDQRTPRPRRDPRPSRDRRDGPSASEQEPSIRGDEATIDAAILPPALGVSAVPAADLDGEPAPVRRRGRPRRSAETEAAE